MQMTNREKLIQTNIYDLLCRINRSCFPESCVVTALDKDIPSQHCEAQISCEGCIESWLNEEV
jgi:hypothetical protein